MKKSAFYGILAAVSLSLGLSACKNVNTVYDAGGTLEAVSVTVSAKGNGTILRLDVSQGDRVEKDSLLGYIDTTQLHLQKDIFVLKSQLHYYASLQIPSLYTGMSLRLQIHSNR